MLGIWKLWINAFARIDRLTGEESRASQLFARFEERLLAKFSLVISFRRDSNGEPAATLLTRIRTKQAVKTYRTRSPKEIKL